MTNAERLIAAGWRQAPRVHGMTPTPYQWSRDGIDWYTSEEALSELNAPAADEIASIRAEVARLTAERNRAQRESLSVMEALGLVSRDDTGRIGDVGSVGDALAEIARLQDEDRAREVHDLLYEKDEEIARLRAEVEARPAITPEDALGHRDAKRARLCRHATTAKNWHSEEVVETALREHAKKVSR